MELRKKLGIVFQNPENQILFNDVYEDMLFGLNNLKLNDPDLRIKEALAKVKMDEYIHGNTYELSLGQKQRITIAGVLASNPKYIIFDEPTTMIDSEGEAKIYKILHELKNLGITIIYITNVIDEILMSDRVIILNKGEIKGDFRKQNILENVDIIEENGIKLPKIVKTLLELKNNGIEINLEEWTNEELTKKIIEGYKK